ncbi:hypothetical protein V2J09_016838 [Rumex salicifolius]
MHQNGATRLKLILIDERQYADVILRSDRRRNDSMILVDKLLQIADAHGSTTEIINFRAILLIFDAVELEEAELALGERGDSGQAGGGLRALLLALLAADSGRRRRRFVLLVLLVAVVLPVAATLPNRGVNEDELQRSVECFDPNSNFLLTGSLYQSTRPAQFVVVKPSRCRGRDFSIFAGPIPLFVPSPSKSPKSLVPLFLIVQLSPRRSPPISASSPVALSAASLPR